MKTGKKRDFRTGLHHLHIPYEKGDVIFREEDARDKAYIIEHGEVEISTTRGGKSVPLVRLGPGEVFGETALLGPGQRSATATAITDAEVFALPPEILRDRVMRLDPLVGLLMSLLINRYRQWRYVSPEEAEKGGTVAHEEEDMGSAPHADDFLSDLDRQKQVALDELRMAQEITRAIKLGQFEPHLQPILSLPERRIAGFEALIRWNHPQKGMIPPIDFIPVAERTQVIWDLDMMTLQRACEISTRLRDAAGSDTPPYISVNLSGVLFDSPDLARRIAEIVKANGADPASLVLEITESALMGDPAAAEQALKDLRALGLRVALDDFGTGYSSLSYLHRFAIDILKIDRAFVQDIEANKRNLDIVRAIVSLAQTFGLSIVGEGVENEGEASALAALGCDCGQGYLFGKPMPVEEAVAFLRQGKKS